MALAAIIDIDGTLVDSNYQHALAWYRAFRLQGITVPLWRCHRAIGMGGDQLVAYLAGEGFDDAYGDEVRLVEHALFQQMIGEVQPFDGARGLIETLKSRGCSVMLASSAKPGDVTRYVDLLDASELVDGWSDSSSGRSASAVAASAPTSCAKPVPSRCSTRSASFASTFPTRRSDSAVDQPTAPA